MRGTHQNAAQNRMTAQITIMTHIGSTIIVPEMTTKLLRSPCDMQQGKNPATRVFSVLGNVGAYALQHTGGTAGSSEDSKMEMDNQGYNKMTPAEW